MQMKYALVAVPVIVLTAALVYAAASITGNGETDDTTDAVTPVLEEPRTEDAAATNDTDTATEPTGEEAAAPTPVPLTPPAAPTPVPEPTLPPQDNGTPESPEATVYDHSAFMQCLDDAGVVIYGSRTCPACARLSQEYGGYDMMSPIYVECTVYPERCQQEMLVNYVPAVQIRGEIFEGWGSPQNLSIVTGCPLPQ